MTTVEQWLAAHGDLDRRDREVLLGHAAGLSRAQIYAHPEHPLPACLSERLADWARRRRRGEPVAYIVGTREFWGLELTVTPHVLIPRPETELLVELVCAAAADSQNVNDGPIHRDAVDVLELGTGSGAVAIAVAHEATRRGLPLRVSATDLSRAALAVARRNAGRHQADVRWIESDWFAAVRGGYHVIVSNPPYVAVHDTHLDALDFEPRLALTAGPDGLDAIRAITAGAPAHLVAGGLLAVEHGCDQGGAVRALLERAGFVEVSTLPDLAGLDRVTRGRWPEEPLCHAS